MAQGLSLMAGGMGAVRGTATYGSSSPGASSVVDAAFGPGADAAAPRPAGLLLPNDAFGITLWSGVAAVALLLIVRHSLPR